MKRIKERQVSDFFDSFVEAFSSFEGREIAQLYCEPFIAIDESGRQTSFATTSDIAAYFQDFLDAYAAQGCKSCRYHSLDFRQFGEHSVLATVIWELLDDCQAVKSHWKESYGLLRSNDKFRVFTSIDHPATDL